MAPFLLTLCTWIPIRLQSLCKYPFHHYVLVFQLWSINNIPIFKIKCPTPCFFSTRGTLCIYCFYFPDCFLIELNLSSSGFIYPHKVSLIYMSYLSQRLNICPSQYTSDPSLSATYFHYKSNTTPWSVTVAQLVTHCPYHPKEDAGTASILTGAFAYL